VFICGYSFTLSSVNDRASSIAFSRMVMANRPCSGLTRAPNTEGQYISPSTIGRMTPVSAAASLNSEK